MRRETPEIVGFQSPGTYLAREKDLDKTVIINGAILIYILGTDSEISILYRVSLVYRPPPHTATLKCSNATAQ